MSCAVLIGSLDSGYSHPTILLTADTRIQRNPFLLMFCNSMPPPALVMKHAFWHFVLEPPGSSMRSPRQTIWGKLMVPEALQKILLLSACQSSLTGSAQAAAVATAASISKKRTSILNRINLGGFQTSTKIEALVSAEPRAHTQLYFFRTEFEGLYRMVLALYGFRWSRGFQVKNDVQIGEGLPDYLLVILSTG